MFDRCHFPVSKANKVTGHGYREVELFTKDQFPSVNIELVQAAWAILLRSYIREDIVSFVVISGPPRQQIDGTTSPVDLVGEDVNLSLFRYELVGDSLLQDIRPAASIPIAEGVLERLLVNTAIDLTSQSLVRDDDHDDIPSTPIHCLSKPDNPFDLLLHWNQSIAGNMCMLRYCSAAVSVRYATAIVCSFQKILSGAIQLDTYIRDLRNLASTDVQVLRRWNHEVLFSQRSCMHHLVEATARVTPNAEAVCSWDGSLTYDELERLSSVVAQRLIHDGVRQGEFVAFAYQKTMYTVIATLGILKAGAALVPLDPLHPRARLAEILHRTKARIVVTSDPFVNSFKDLVNKVLIVSKTTIDKSCSLEPGGPWFAEAGPDDPVWVLFTSGSTGYPKGIIHEHGAMCSHAIIHGKAMRFQHARVLQFATHTFDMALFEIFTTLAFGGCICIPSEEERKTSIVTVINNMKIDWVFLTPSMAAILDPRDVPTLKTLAVGGEALSRACLDRWADKVDFIQISGPAEVGICTAVKMVSGDIPLNIGRALDNSSCWLVDSDDPHKLVPIGAIGELVVAGPSVARGYLDDPVRTEASFLRGLAWAASTPFADDRFYRTGDLLRYNTDSFDGGFTFVGRKDAQIKLRGQRIEAGEVEHHIGQFAGLTTSVVMKPDTGVCTGQLVAVVQVGEPQSGYTQDEAILMDVDNHLQLHELESHLAKALPDYMIPTAYFTVKRIPLNPSLKTDRKCVREWLNAMEFANDTTGIVFSKDLGDLGLSALFLEESLAKELSHEVGRILSSKDATLSSVLRDNDFRIHAAGVDSIQIMAIFMFIQKKYETKIPLAELLHPKATVRSLATYIATPHMATRDQDLQTLFDVAHEAEGIYSALMAVLPSNKFHFHAPVRCDSMFGSSPENSNDVRVNENAISRSHKFRNVLLTGATGYLGTAILHHLLMGTTCTITVLVRCDDEKHGLDRIKNTAKAAGWWKDIYISRITVWPGDLAAPKLRLSDDRINFLKGERLGENQASIDAVIHNGATVHYIQSYQQLRSANVDGTTELLKLMAQSPDCNTLVFISGGRKPNIRVDDEHWLRDVRYASGYAQSKFVAEQLILRCVNHPSFSDKALRVVQPGYIIASKDMGAPVTTDFIWRFVAGCIEIGAYNADTVSDWLFIADMERVASDVMDTMFRRQNSSGNTSQVLDGLYFSELWAILKEQFGYRLQPMAYEPWMDHMKSSILSKGQDHLLYPLLHVLERESGAIGTCEVPRVIEESSKRAKNAVTKNVRQLIEQDFLPKPSKGLQVEGFSTPNMLHS